MKAEVSETFPELHWSDFSIEHNEVAILSIPIKSDIAKIVENNFNSALESHVKSELVKLLEEFTDEWIDDNPINSNDWKFGVKWLRDSLLNKLK